MTERVCPKFMWRLLRRYYVRPTNIAIRMQELNERKTIAKHISSMGHHVFRIPIFYRRPTGDPVGIGSDGTLAYVWISVVSTMTDMAGTAERQKEVM